MSCLGPFLLGFTGFYWILPGFTGFYSVLPGFTGFYWVLLGFPGFYRVLLDFTGFLWVLLGFYGLILNFTGFYWVLLGFAGLYRVVQGFIGFYRVRSGCWRVDFVASDVSSEDWHVAWWQRGAAGRRIGRHLHISCLSSRDRATRVAGALIGARSPTGVTPSVRAEKRPSPSIAGIPSIPGIRSRIAGISLFLEAPSPAVISADV